MSEETLRVRFAPSPTGYLHIGGARTCLFNWLYARKCAGELILRIEDTDLARSKKEFLDEILESIEWLGMDWDQIYYQSERFDIYHEYAKKLIDQGSAYKKEGAVFFKYNFDQVKIDDLIRGEIIFKELPKNEEVIIKSDNSPTYNFSCVIDDALMEINCIIRGEDHISNTPKQLLMYKALGFKTPQFAHVPLILSGQGGRLSKRFGATSIRQYRQEGYLSESIVNYLMLLGWSPGENREIISLSEAKEIFTMKAVNKTGAAFSLDKLNWINGEYIRQKTTEDFSDLIINYLKENNALPESIDKNYLNKLASLFKERTLRLSDLLTALKPYLNDEVIYSDEAKKILDNSLIKEVSFLRDSLDKIGDFNKEDIEKTFRKAAEDLNIKLKILVHPSRIALTGTKHGPGLFETIETLGKERVIKRLNKLIDYWSQKQ